MKNQSFQNQTQNKIKTTYLSLQFNQQKNLLVDQSQQQQQQFQQQQQYQQKLSSLSNFNDIDQNNKLQSIKNSIRILKFSRKNKLIQLSNNYLNKYLLLKQTRTQQLTIFIKNIHSRILQLFQQINMFDIFDHPRYLKKKILELKKSKSQGKIQKFLAKRQIRQLFFSYLSNNINNKIKSLQKQRIKEKQEKKQDYNNQMQIEIKQNNHNILNQVNWKIQQQEVKKVDYYQDKQREEQLKIEKQVAKKQNFHDKQIQCQNQKQCLLKPTKAYEYSATAIKPFLNTILSNEELSFIQKLINIKYLSSLQKKLQFIEIQKTERKKKRLNQSKIKIIEKVKFCKLSDLQKNKIIFKSKRKTIKKLNLQKKDLQKYKKISINQKSA